MKRWCPVLLFAVGCGDALVTADYRGEPIISLEGRILDFSNAEVGETLRASIFWPRSDTTRASPTSLVEQTSIETRVTFPATFEINVFELPPLERLPPRPFHIGIVLVYSDTNGDGRFSEGELRGGSADLALMHTLEPIPREASPTGLPIARGFSVVHLPLACGFERPKSDFSDACGVPLGASCTEDSQCGNEGMCIISDSFAEFPNGYCALDRRVGCFPADGVPIPYWPQEAEEPIEVFGQSCVTDEDCRLDEGYLCYQEFGACLPAQPLLIDIFPEFTPAPFCVQEWLSGHR